MGVGSKDGPKHRVQCQKGPEKENRTQWLEQEKQTWTLSSQQLSNHTHTMSPT